jgi:hypothetical protein
LRVTVLQKSELDRRVVDASNFAVGFTTPLFPRFFSGSEARESRFGSKSVLLRELRFLVRKEPVNQLTQKAETEGSRLFAFLAPFSRVCDDLGHCTEILVPQRLLSGSESNHGGWARTPGATLSNSLTLWLTSAIP